MPHGCGGREPIDDRVNLAEFLSAEQLLSLAEAFGGTRLYIPHQLWHSHPIALAIGLSDGLNLTAQLGGVVVRVPLMRGERARHHRSAGRSIAWIARHLCMTENGVGRILKRIGQDAG